MLRTQIAAALDLAVLSPNATPGDVFSACLDVEREGLASICVPPSYVAYAKRYTDRVCCVVGFPHGNTFPNIKWREAMLAIERGATELDVVINYGQFLSGRSTLIRRELKDIVRSAHRHNVKVKAILETCYYTADQIREACQLCVQYEVDWVKTSTGFGPSGATTQDAAIMLDAVGDKAQVKASGGIKCHTDAVRYLSLGCTRIGSSRCEELFQ